ncbi:MAG: hypothetical protein K2I09_09595 [Duncaniella sp.]|nr:hypothetical protein [Duncaniella sp.]
MKITLAKIFLSAVLAGTLSAPAAFAVNPSEPDAETVEMLTGEVVIPDEATDIDIAIPSFIHRNANHIILNGADWSQLRDAFLASGDRPVSIVHIGDSHVQADISSGTTRELLQYDFGNAGRGLVSPLKMSGTNQPNDYVFQSRNSWNPVKLMSSTWRHTMGFTGTSIRPMTASSEITIGTSDRDDYDPFRSLILFHNGSLTVRNVTSGSGEKLDFRAIPSHDYTQILLTLPQTHVTIDFASAGDLTVYGAMLSGDRPGLFYHAIGNNGAAYETYNRIGNVGAGIAPLSPDLIIISLGTNEAFGKLNTTSFKNSVDRLVKNIRGANPDALLLLTTPMECHRSVATTRKVRVRGKNGKRRTVNRTSRTYSVNPNIAPLRDVILDYGKEHGIAVYDWYEVAGGRGASSSWISNKLFAKDRVHHTVKGYNIEGRLLYDALMDAIR